jgi:F-type H+-transporting ATPase subunit b
LIHIKSLSRCAFHWILLTALSFGALASPAAVFAQAADPASDQNPAVQTQPATDAKPHEGFVATQEKKEEAIDIEQYRHSATVHWVAKTLNIDLETAAKTFEFINFGILVLAIAIPLIKIVPKILKKRTAKLGFELEVAKSMTEDANRRLAEVEAKLAGLDVEVSAIRKQVEEDIKGDEARIKASIEEESARIVASAEQEIVMAGAQAQRGLREFAADLAIDRALSQLSLDAATDSALIAEFAHDVTAKHGKRGQN